MIRYFPGVRTLFSVFIPCLYRANLNPAVMVSHCANPLCSVPLRYLREGRLYQFEVKSLLAPQLSHTLAEGKRQSRRVWHYWLCGRCAGSMTLAFDQREGLKVVPLASTYPVQLHSGSHAERPPELAG
jgi:hypothetical protein